MVVEVTTVDRLRFWVAITIVAAWVISLIVAAIVPSFRPQAAVTPLMLIVAGWLFGPTITGRGGKK